MTERTDWEKHKNYPPRWSWATWPERGQIIAAWIVSGCIGIALFIGVLMLLGQMIEVAGQRSQDHDRCMKHATNGYEIERCQ